MGKNRISSAKIAAAQPPEKGLQATNQRRFEAANAGGKTNGQQKKTTQHKTARKAKLRGQKTRGTGTRDARNKAGQRGSRKRGPRIAGRYKPCANELTAQYDTRPERIGTPTVLSQKKAHELQLGRSHEGSENDGLSSKSQIYDWTIRPHRTRGKRAVFVDVEITKLISLHIRICSSSAL